MDDASLVGTVLNLTGLGVLDSGRDVRRHGADLRVRHQATGTQDLAQGTHDTHRVGRSDDHVKVHLTGLDLVSQVVQANDVGAGSLGGLSLVALGEHGNANRLAGAGGQNDRTANQLVRLLRVDAELHGHVNGFIELGDGGFLDQGQGFSDRVQLGAVDLLRNSGCALGQFCHD
ncbi:hypothetical protein D3C78_1492400 [compost metagenome]